MPKDKRIVNIEINSHNICAECRCAQPVKSEYGPIHDGDCPKHDPTTCLVCSNLRAMGIQLEG